MKTYQLGMDERYSAHVISLWIDEDKPCDLLFRKPKTLGLVCVEVTDTILTNKILVATNCKVHIKE